MGLESSPTVIDDLNSAWPLGTDQAATSDDHHRNIKAVLTAVFAGIEGVAGAGPLVDAFASGTLMLFQQTAAPTGWTKQTTHNNKALRIITGTVSTGGTKTFTTTFGAGKTADSHTLITAEMPAHTHDVKVYAPGTTGPNRIGLEPNNDGSSPTIYNDALTKGGDGGHTHPLTNFDLQYVDFIIASKD